MCAVPNMAVFRSSFTSDFPGMLSTYFLNEFEILPVAPIIIIIIIINWNWVVTRWQWLFYMYINNMKLFANKFKSAVLHEKHLVAT